VESPPVEYEVDYIVEKLEIGLWDSYNHEYVVDVGAVRQSGQVTGQLNLTVYLVDDKGNYLGSDPYTELTVTEIKLTDEPTSYITTGDSPVKVNESEFRKIYSFDRAGNYSITAEVMNTRVNPDSGSAYYEISETWEGFLNILPVPVVDTTVTPQGITYRVTFDASDSFNDGDITLYKWDFDNDGEFDEITTEPIVFNDYITASSFTAVLNIVGDVVDPDTDEMEVGSITVEGP
jgi:PKD repeat protein